MFIYKFWQSVCKRLFDEDEVTPVFLTMFTVMLVGGFFIYGATNANNPQKCRISKIADFTLTLPYALGCNLFKDRFDYKLN